MYHSWECCSAWPSKVQKSWIGYSTRIPHLHPDRGAYRECSVLALDPAPVSWYRYLPSFSLYNFSLEETKPWHSTIAQGSTNSLSFLASRAACWPHRGVPLAACWSKHLGICVRKPAKGLEISRHILQVSSGCQNTRYSVQN